MTGTPSAWTSRTRTFGRGQHEVAIVGDAQRACPAIEDLDDVGAGGDLLRGVFAEDGDELVEQHPPRGGLAIHQRLGVDVVARASALDHVAGEGERCSAKADDAEAVFEVGDDALDGLGDVAEFGGAVGAQALNIGERANRMMNDRAFAGLKLKGQSHAFEGQQQVGEDDRGVDIELLGGGDGDLGGELGLLADFEQGVVLADGLILRHIAARLAQKPHRRAVDRTAQAGAHEAAAGGERGGLESRADLMRGAGETLVIAW